MDRLLAAGNFGEATSVVELGCGTGRIAERLLAGELPPTARYRGFDLSPRMVGLASRRLERFGSRARVLPSDGELRFELPDGAADRFLATFVLDLLSTRNARAAIAEARRLLTVGGLLCLAGLSGGHNAASRCVAGLWTTVHRLRPGLVGGCRPVERLPLLAGGEWQVVTHERVAPWGIPSEVVVARRL